MASLKYLIVAFLINQSCRLSLTSDVVTLDNATDTRTISTHILDINLGHSTGNVPVTISRLQDNEDWLELNQAVTDGDGRIHQLLDFNDFKTGIYKLKFHTQPYFQLKGVKSFYPHIEIVIDCETGQHYHIPLILARYGYTTYRGS